MRTISFLGILIILLGCSQESKQDSIFEHNILIAENVGKYTEMKLSSIISKLEYIPLETKKSSLMGYYYVIKIIVNNDFMFIGGPDYLYVFSRDGKFLNQIGALGNGPGEYKNVGDISINNSKQTIFIHYLREIREYTWGGKYLKTIHVPKIDEIPNSYIISHIFAENNTFIGHIMNLDNQKYKFCLFDDQGEINKLLPNTLFIPTDDETGLYNYQNYINFSKYNNKWYLKETINDTLSYLDGTELVPFALFDTGKYRLIDKVPKSGNWITEQTISFWHNIVISSDFIFFEMIGNKIDLPKNRREREVVFRNTSEIQITMPENQPTRYKGSTISGVYDMKNKKTTLLENDPCGIYGLVNDLDGGLPFWPRYCTDDNKLVSILSAEDLKGILTEEYFAAHEIKDKQAHQKLRALLKNLKEDDNPVVVIATLK